MYCVIHAGTEEVICLWNSSEQESIPVLDNILETQLRTPHEMCPDSVFI